MMFKCIECGHLFEQGEEKRWIESYGEEFGACPCCGGDYEEAKECKYCEEFICSENQKFCEECQENMLNWFEETFKHLIKNFDDIQKDLLYYLWEEEKIDVQKIIDNCDSNDDGSNI